MSPESVGGGVAGAFGGSDATDRPPVLQINERLTVFYGEPEPRPDQDPLSELIQTVLSQNTADVNSDRAYASLMERFGSDWEAVRTAPTSEIADAIRIGGLAEIKAARIKAILEEIESRLGELDLTFLRSIPLDEGRAFLRSLGGVGPKTAACVLLFSCGKPALPVDTHVHRVSQRLGLVSPKATAEQAHALLEAMIPPEEVYRFHMNLIRHGRQICKAQRPRCYECPVADLCAFPDKMPAPARGSAGSAGTAGSSRGPA
jgi:endonuclease-3